MKRRNSLMLVGGALAASALIGAAHSVSAAPAATAAQRSVAKQTLALDAGVTVRRRSYKRRLQLAGGNGRYGGKTPFVTKGNRAQRARQHAGMSCLH